MRIALGISYEGTAYCGWQSQHQAVPTLQDALQTALSNVANHPIKVVCAGRTDAGVHALGQVVHFDTTAVRPFKAWIYGTNSYLPRDIRVDWVQPVNDTFHARFTATARQYRYVIFNHGVHSALLRNQTTWYCRHLDESRMVEASQFLLGEHDFSSFRAAACQANTPIRTVHQLDVYRKENYIFVDIKANAFLHHMVRNIVGMLMAVGSCKRDPVWAKELLEARNRAQGDITAPASGLYFIRAEYPASFKLPIPVNPLLFW